MSVTWRISLGNLGFFGLCGIQIPKITSLSYLGEVFEGLTNKFKDDFNDFKDDFKNSMI